MREAVRSFIDACVTDELTTLEAAHPIEPPDLTLKLYSAINRVLFWARKKRRWSRSHYIETPAWELHQLDNKQQLRIDELKKQYKVRFEDTLARGNALENYHLLDILDQLSNKWHWQPENKSHIDVGCKNFYYAACLQAFFRPAVLTGIELDAHGWYHDFHTRASYAQYYIKDFINTSFIGGDFCQQKLKADLLTFFYPFVIPEPLVRWDLPLSEFKPDRLFQHAFETLTPTGHLLMINQGNDEYQAAKKILTGAGFIKIHTHHALQTLLTRHHTPIASLWIKCETTNEVIHHAAL